MRRTQIPGRRSGLFAFGKLLRSGKAAGRHLVLPQHQLRDAEIEISIREVWVSLDDLLQGDGSFAEAILFIWLESERPLVERRTFALAITSPRERRVGIDHDGCFLDVRLK